VGEKAAGEYATLGRSEEATWVRRRERELLYHNACNTG
jgi:hypothetical protein